MASSSAMGARYGRDRLTVERYLELPESVRPMELAFGAVREPPAPFYSHQALVTRIAVMLYRHVDERGLGKVCVSPVDVVLDRERALVVQPDIIFIARDRLHILGSRVWGPPDLVVEVLSPTTARRDRTTKLTWYERYGVRECWLVDASARAVDVVRFAPSRRSRTFAAGTTIESFVLPELSAGVQMMFE